VLRWGALGVSTLVAAGCGGGGTSRSTPTSPPPPSPLTGPTTTEPAASVWSQLAGSLSGRLVRPGDAGYLGDLQLYDSRFDSIRPAALAYCANPADVQRCVGFARDHGVNLAARCGGHSYGGYSTSTGLVIDVTSMGHVQVNGDGTATVGTGARLIDVYSALNAQGVSIPAGSCPTVGIAGLTLGGGAGVVGRAQGLTCDRLTGLQAVTADGRLVRADAATNSDLFWACRGGGGGNFAIASEFTFSTFPVTQTAVFNLQWPWSAAAEVLPAWLGWAPGAPDQLWSNCVLTTDPTRPAAEIRVGGVWLGSVDGLSALHSRLVTAVGSAPSSRLVEPTPFGHAMYVEAGCASLSQAACHLPAGVAGGSPGGTLTRQPSLAKSNYLMTALGDAGVRAVLAGLDGRRGDGGAGAVGFDAYGGAINRVAPDATAFVHRSALASAQYSVPFTPGTAPSVLAAGQTWLDGWYASMQPYVSPAAYQNYIDPSLADWAQAYYGSNLPRLQRVKRAWDPDNVFHFAQSIRLA
jgi:FAD/FMN-containing dehydrogenase